MARYGYATMSSASGLRTRTFTSSKVSIISSVGPLPGIEHRPWYTILNDELWAFGKLAGWVKSIQLLDEVKGKTRAPGCALVFAIDGGHVRVTYVPIPVRLHDGAYS